MFGVFGGRAYPSGVLGRWGISIPRMMDAYIAIMMEEGEEGEG